MNNKRLVIADPSLKDERGHHYALSKVISAGALKKGIELIWLVHKKHTLESLQGIKIIPTFSSSMYDSISQDSKKTLIDVHFISRIPEYLHPILIKIRDIIKILIPKRYTRYLLGINAIESQTQIFARELSQAVIENNITLPDELLIHSADGTIYRGILAILQKKLWENFPRLHLCTSYDEKMMPHYNNGLSVTRIIEYYKLLGVLDQKIFLYAENYPLSQHLKQLWNVNLTPLEIPILERDALLEKKIIVETPQSRLNIVYLGAAREEKGFLLLPKIIKKTLQHQELKKNIHFTIQCSPQIIGYSPSIKKAIARLKKYPSDLVHLIEHKQSMEDYYAMLDNADVVLLCYQQNKYQYRGSGIAVEAISSAKIVIVSPDTFPAEIAGEAGLHASDANEIVEKLMSITNDYKKYAMASKKRMKEYNQSHSASAYIDILWARK